MTRLAYRQPAHWAVGFELSRREGIGETGGLGVRGNRGLRICALGAMLAGAYRIGRRRREASHPPVDIDLPALEQAQVLERERMAREAIEHANADVESLIYTVSHDLKSPLITVLGYIDLLHADGVELPDDAAHYIERIEAGAQYMQELINDLLLLSRIGRMEMNNEDVELAVIVAEVLDELEVRPPRASINVGPLPVVTMSPVRARQLLGNLIENALIHSGRDDVIVEVGAETTPDGGARLWVADDGCGVRADERERAFGVFERLGERPAGEGGTGVGLTVCRKIMTHVGGAISLADVPVGTTAEVVFPAPIVAWRTSEVGVGR